MLVNNCAGTGNSIQDSVITYLGKESEKEQICVLLIHFAVHLKLIQHCKSTILLYKIKTEKKIIIVLVVWVALNSKPLSLSLHLTHNQG